MKLLYVSYNARLRGNFVRIMTLIPTINLLISYSKTEALYPEDNLVTQQESKRSACAIEGLLIVSSSNELSERLVVVESRTPSAHVCVLVNASTPSVCRNFSNISQWKDNFCTLISRTWRTTFRNDHCWRSNLSSEFEELQGLFKNSIKHSNTIMILLLKNQHMQRNSGSGKLPEEAKKILRIAFTFKLTDRFSSKDKHGFSTMGYQHNEEVEKRIEVVTCSGSRCTEPRSLSCKCSQPTTKGSSCQLLANQAKSKRDASGGRCHDNTCLNGGTCLRAVGKLVCKCREGFTGERCETGTNNCHSEPCKNGGTCFDLPKGFKCCCAKQYAGRFCQRQKSPCDYKKCLNGGTCTSSIAQEARCRCRIGFSGNRCEINLEYQIDYRAEFPGYSNQYIKLHNNRHLTAVTVAFWMKSSFRNLHHRGTPLSYSYQNPYTKGIEDNGLTLYDTNRLMLYLHGKKIITGIVGNSDNAWHHCAVTWESQDGEWAIYWDGEVKANGSKVAKGSRLWSGYFVLGQEQDSLGGTYSSLESYIGGISQFNVWDHAVPKDKIRLLRKSCGISGNVWSWGDVRARKGEGPLSALIKTTDLCAAIGMCVEEDCYCNQDTSIRKQTCWRGLDVPTCNPNPCANGQKCIEKNGSPQCRCEKGYEGIRCQYDVDECVVNNGNCSEECIDLKGSYKCSCKSGKRLASDDRRCVETAFCYHKSGDDTFMFDDGYTWTENCTDCRCDRGEVLCNPKRCPKVNCRPNEKEVPSSDKCCKTCVVDVSHCNYKGRIYTNDDTWKSGCSACSCNKGLVKCVKLTCPVLQCAKDETDVLLPSNCCRECVKKQSVCRINGQEINTFDGLRYTFSGKHPYNLVANCKNEDISIQHETSPYRLQDTYLVIYYKCLEVQVNSKGSAFVEREEVKLPYESGFISVNASFHRDSANVFITLVNGMRITWEATKIEIWTPSEYKGQLSGLCGNFNGEDSDDRPELPTESDVSSYPEPTESSSGSHTGVMPKSCVSCLVAFVLASSLFICQHAMYI